MQKIYRRTTVPKWDFNKVAKQLYWNHTLAWVFSCKFTAYFQNSFFLKHLWVTASVYSPINCCEMAIFLYEQHSNKGVIHYYCYYLADYYRARDNHGYTIHCLETWNRRYIWNVLFVVVIRFCCALFIEFLRVCRSKEVFNKNWDEN